MQLWDKIIAGNATLLEGTGGSQITGTKHKEINTIFSKDKVEQWPSKKNKEKQSRKYYGDARIKIGGVNLCEKYVHTGQDCLMHNSRWVKIIFCFFSINNLLHSCSLICTGYITIKQKCIPHTNTNSLAMILTYGGVLSIIEKALWNIVEEYWSIGKSLQNLVED